MVASDVTMYKIGVVVGGRIRCMYVWVLVGFLGFDIIVWV